MKRMKRIIVWSLFLMFVKSNAQIQPRLDLNIMTFNIRYDNPEDGLNSWKFRKEHVTKAIRFYEVAILGAQEVLLNQFNEMSQQLPEYTAIGVGREDGKTKGEFSPILFKKNQLIAVQSGFFWLSETPDKPSKGWDAACERMATWAILKDKISAKKVFVLNTHLDHVGQIARAASVKLLKNKIIELSQGLPQIVMGDFNATPESDVIKGGMLLPLNSGSLFDSKELATIVYGPDWSYHDFGRLSFKERPLIDYIFVSKEIKVRQYGVLAEALNEMQLSDHTPVLTKLSL